MDRSDYSDADYRHPHVPPSTPPVIDQNADAGEAATLALDNGDSHDPGSQPADFDRGREDEALFDGGGDRDFPGEQPDEIVPGQGDTDVPERTPDEVSPDQGDFDRPGGSPVELPPQPGSTPGETPPTD